MARVVPKEGTDADGRPVQYSQFMPVPYNLEIEMAILSKNQDDGLQILEQILPNFHPALNVSIVVIDETKEERDIAIVLNGIGYTDDYEGDYTTRRTLIWTLNFTVKTYLFGPVSAQRDIRKVVLDYRSDIVNRPAELGTLLNLCPLRHHQFHETRSILPRRDPTRLLRPLRMSMPVTQSSSG